MAIAMTALTTGSDLSNVTHPSTYTTASFTAHANCLVLLAIGTSNNVNATIGSTPEFSGSLSGSWTQIRVVKNDSSDRQGLFLYRRMESADSTGTVAIAPHSGETWRSMAWSICEFSGVDTSGTNGSGAIVQDVGNELASSGTTITATLAAFGSSDNRPYGAFYLSSLNEDIVPGTNFTQIHEPTTVENRELMTAWAQTTADTTVDASWTTSVTPAAVIAVEIKMAATAADDLSVLAAPRIHISMP